MTTYKIVSNGKKFRIKCFPEGEEAFIAEMWYVEDYLPWWYRDWFSFDEFETKDLKQAYNIVRKLIQRDKFLALKESFDEKFKSTNHYNWVEL
jgi:hypothetical protein